jgi:flagellar motor switch protein FliM
MAIGNGSKSAPIDGLKRLIDAPKLAFDKAPVLHAVFDRLAGSCADGMRSFCSAPSTFMLNGLSSGSTWDLLEAYETGFGAIFHSPEWDARIVIGCDRRFAFSIVEAMFGADGSEPPLDGDRPLTTLEGRIVREILIDTAAALRAQLAFICDTTFHFERTETSLDFSTIGLSDAPAVMAQLIIQVMDGGGRLFVLIPNNALAPFRKRLERDRPPEAVHVDSAWSRQLLLELGRTEIELKAVLDGSQLSLKAMSRLQPGQILPLDASSSTPIGLEAEDKVLFMAKLGQSKGYFTVCIERRVDEREELLNELLGGRAALPQDGSTPGAR